MTNDVSLTHTSALILQTIGSGHRYGFDIMEATGLPSGTVYPALRRLEQSGLIGSKWEKEKDATAQSRPARKYFKLTSAGNRTLEKAIERYPLLQRLAIEPKTRRA
jgi:PadR family transcriptional regulator, regulatory protein PadR